MLGCTQAAVLVVETYGVAHTSAGNAGLLISLTVLLTPLLDRRGPGSALPARFYGAIGIALVGIGILVGGVHAPRSGDVLILAAAVIRAFHVVLIGRLPSARTARPAQLTAAQTIVGTLLLLPVALPHVADLSDAGAGTWAWLVYLALGCSVFAFIAQTWAVQHSSPSRASLLLGTEPVWALLVAAVLGGEPLTTTGALGALLVVTGTYWGQSVERAHRTTEEVRPRQDSAPSPV